jgi:hypothetical protein
MDKPNETLLRAMMLLIDRNLEWSGDFENIRPALGALFNSQLNNPLPNQHIIRVAEALIDNGDLAQ